jgi:putative acyl-CoA dehydrogenase
VEESGLPRIYRQQPLHSIWEGSGNVVCLDVLRAFRREPGSAEALLDEIRLAGEPRLGQEAESALAIADEGSARRLVERLALALQGSLLIRHAPAAVADAFLDSRVRSGHAAYGVLPAGAHLGSVVERHTPRLTDE